MKIEDSGRYCCHKCFHAPGQDKPLFRQRMILCSVCGNKRCPKATDHDLACTNSNEEGQLGSVYGTLLAPIKKH